MAPLVCEVRKKYVKKRQDRVQVLALRDSGMAKETWRSRGVGKTVS